MTSFNKIVVVGNLGRDPELRYLPDGTQVCSFTVAANDARKDPAGSEQPSTTWFKVIIFGEQARPSGEYLRRGSQVYAEGRLRMNEYTDRDGNARFSLEVVANDVRILSRAEQSAEQQDAEEIAPTRARAATARGSRRNY